MAYQRITGWRNLIISDMDRHLHKKVIFNLRNRNKLIKGKRSSFKFIILNFVTSAAAFI